MGLRDLANEVLADFDPKTDDPNKGGNGDLPDGEYDVTLINVEHKIYQSGWEAVVFDHEVTVGDAAGKTQALRLNFDTSTTPEFVFQKNIKLVAKLAAVIGLQLTEDDWEDEQTLATAFQDGVGSQYILNVTSTRGKKDPSKEYKNYDFIPYDDPATTVVDIPDDELPY